MIDPSRWVHSLAGGIHFVCSVIGMLSGMFVLLNTKGTALHRKIGYVFAAALVGVNLSALMIYDFNDGSVSVFHFLIPVSLFFLGFGIIPMMGRDRFECRDYRRPVATRRALKCEGCPRRAGFG